MANGDILTTLETDIANALKRKLPEDKRLMFNTFRAMVIFLKDDHARLADMTPKVNTLWECKEQEDKDKKETRRMILSPIYNTVITWIISTLITLLGIHFLG
jgi:hypothetical protein